MSIIAAMIFVATLISMGFTVWHQRRADRAAAVPPEQT
jgi:hypothetical protein